MADRRLVGVTVATLWTSPEAPRPLDRLAVQDDPDVAGWAAAMDVTARHDLHGRTLTQLLLGEPAVVIDEADDWARVVVPLQPSSRDHRGYPGWVRRSHLTDLSGAHGAVAPPSPDHSGLAATGEALATARELLTVQYLWGGTSRWGVDCSGLVHLAFRAEGVVVPRDAADQADHARRVPLDHVEPGDLYFFAEPGEPVTHVGFASRPVEPDGTRWMVHAPETGAVVEEAPMQARRLASLVAAGRVVV